ncbi:MAG: type I DNA topoisomerase [Planctomycetota bacterium]
MAAKKNATGSGKTLVIVESPAKARTIGKYLGKDYAVEASIGHIRDLPSGKKEMPEALKKETWARLGVNTEEEFKPIYVVPDEKKKQVAKLKQALAESDALFLATDEDREGEAISWHLVETLKPKVPVKRLVFHEITKTAIEQALANPRDIDEGLVKAQETRRILDRLYGYEMSEFLWKKSLGRSAGRVQSVAVRLLVERERERMAFVSASYWDLVGHFLTGGQEKLDAVLQSVDGRKIPSGKDFDPATGKIKDPACLLLNEQQVNELAARLKTAKFEVSAVDVKPYSRSPAAPFTTSTLQQEANRKLGFTARRTMNAAQSLYENGFITYMRTDSTTLSSEAVAAARKLVEGEYGREYLPSEPRTYVSKVKNAQEAHEAIRPTGQSFRMLNDVRRELRDDEFRLYELIWKRTVASQMVNSRGNNIIVTINGGGALFQVSGKTIEFPGFLRAYVEGSDDPASDLADQEKILPAVQPGQRLDCERLESKSHSTQPPARYSEAALTRELERRGIGRPSTYASIIDTIQARDYVFKKGGYLVPSWSAFSVVRLMEEHFPSLVDYDFTAQMEDVMDAISRDEADNVKYLEQFYHGVAGQSGRPGLKQQLETKLREVDSREVCTFPLGTPQTGEHCDPVNVRVGRYGPYLEQGPRTSPLRDETAPDELNLTKALEMLNQAQVGEEPLGYCPETGRPVYLKQGRFGPYVQLAVPEGEEDGKPKKASLLKGMTPAPVTLDTALKLLSLPRDLGINPDSQEPVLAYNGKFGPYVKCGAETRSLPADVSVLDVSLDQAVTLLRQPKAVGRGRGRAAEPVRTFEVSPVTSQPIKLLNGRYGMYLSDGVTNATLPKDVPAEGLTLELALRLLAERAAAGPSKKKAGRSRAGGGGKKAATETVKKVAKKGAKKAAPKKAAGKKAVGKQAASKKSAKKGTGRESFAEPRSGGGEDIPFDVD